MLSLHICLNQWHVFCMRTELQVICKCVYLLFPKWWSCIWCIYDLSIHFVCSISFPVYLITSNLLYIATLCTFKSFFGLNEAYFKILACKFMHLVLIFGCLCCVTKFAYITVNRGLKQCRQRECICMMYLASSVRS